MDTSVLGDVVARLPRGRTLFRYERDYFAVMLVRYLLDAGVSMRALKGGHFAALLDKPALRAFLAARGTVELCPHELDLLAMAAPVSWRLTVGRWGDPKHFRRMQTSRRGANIVLQLNFSRTHDSVFDALLGPQAERLFMWRGHPVSGRERTLAWARIDADLETGEALIEEIQSDWVREVAWANRSPQAAYEHWCGVQDYGSPACDQQRFTAALKKYTDDVLPAFAGHWQETMMAASLFFVVEELGLRRLYMHQFDTGNALKRIDGARLPPRSIYTDVPRRFRFERVAQGPAFLDCEMRRIARAGKKRKKAVQQPGFWRLDLAGPSATA